MGTDRWPEKTIQCKCGKGSFEITHCEPDHNYVRDHQIWYEGSIGCPECSKKYEIVSGCDKRSIHLKSKETNSSECIFTKE